MRHLERLLILRPRQAQKRKALVLLRRGDLLRHELDERVEGERGGGRAGRAGAERLGHRDADGHGVGEVADRGVHACRPPPERDRDGVVGAVLGLRARGGEHPDEGDGDTEPGGAIPVAPGRQFL